MDRNKEKEKFGKYVKNNDSYQDRGFNNQPYSEGQVLTFKQGGEGEAWRHVSRKIGDEVREWDVFITEEGFEISFSQICRNNNGLMFESDNFAEGLIEFFDRINAEDEEPYSITIDGVKKVETSFGSGKQTILHFKDELYGEEEEEEEEEEEVKEEVKEEVVEKPKHKKKH